MGLYMPHSARKVINDHAKNIANEYDNNDINIEKFIDNMLDNYFCNDPEGKIEEYKFMITSRYEKKIKEIAAGYIHLKNSKDILERMQKKAREISPRKIGDPGWQQMYYQL